MSNFNWTEAPSWMPEAVLYTDLSTDEDRVEIGFYLDYADGKINPSFSINENGDWFSTDSTEDWPMVEKYIPRSEWPEPMFVGQHGAKTRTPDQAIIEAVEAFKKQFAEYLEED